MEGIGHPKLCQVLVGDASVLNRKNENGLSENLLVAIFVTTGRVC